MSTSQMKKLGPSRNTPKNKGPRRGLEPAWKRLSYPTGWQTDWELCPVSSVPHLIMPDMQCPCHIVLPNTAPDRGPPMLSRAVLGGHGMCAWAAGPAAGAPLPAELPHDGCARRRGEPRVEQLPGNRLLSRPTLRPLSPSQGPFFFFSTPPPFSLEPDPACR